MKNEKISRRSFLKAGAVASAVGMLSAAPVAAHAAETDASAAADEENGLLDVFKKGGCILSYNGGKIVDCRTGETLVEKTLDPAHVPELCAFAAAQDIAILTYNREGIVCERDKDEWANKECFTTKLPMIHVDDLASYVNYPVCKMLITLDPARRDAVCAAGQQQFAGRADLYPSSPFFIEAVPQGVAKDGSLAELLRRMGLTRENLMACGDGLNDRSMIAYAGWALPCRTPSSR